MLQLDLATLCGHSAAKRAATFVVLLPRPTLCPCPQKNKFVVFDVVYSVIVCLCSFVIVVFPCMSMFLRVAWNVLLANVF